MPAGITVTQLRWNASCRACCTCSSERSCPERVRRGRRRVRSASARRSAGAVLYSSSHTCWGAGRGAASLVPVTASTRSGKAGSLTNGRRTLGRNRRSRSGFVSCGAGATGTGAAGCVWVNDTAASRMAASRQSVWGRSRKLRFVWATKGSPTQTKPMSGDSSRKIGSRSERAAESTARTESGSTPGNRPVGPYSRGCLTNWVNGSPVCALERGELVRGQFFHHESIGSRSRAVFA